MATFSFNHQLPGRKVWVYGEVTRDPESLERFVARSELFPGFTYGADLMTHATDGFREGLAEWLESHPEQVPAR